MKIFVVSFASYSTMDDYLYTNSRPFTNEEEARKYFEMECELAYEECKWGALLDATDEERDDCDEFHVDRLTGEKYYEVSSEAYDGYKVRIEINGFEL